MGWEELDPHPGRPDDPKFWELSNAVLRMDGTMEGSASEEEKDARLLAYFEEILGVSLDTAIYVAFQRSMRTLLTSEAVSLESVVVNANKLVASWLDGFASGATWRSIYPKDPDDGI